MEDQELNIIFGVIELLQVTKRVRPDFMEIIDHESGKLTKEEINIPKNGIAKTDEEFQEVFNREIRKVNGVDEAFFRSEHIITLRQLVEDIRPFRDKHHDLKEALNNYIQWLKSQEKPQEPGKPQELINEHPEIFTSPFAWHLFKEFQSGIFEKFKLAEYSFIYRKMIYDGFIYSHIKPQSFINWLSSKEFADLEKIKTDCSTHDRMNKYEGIFNSIKNLFHQNNWSMSK
jgi:hypothetical protein